MKLFIGSIIGLVLSVHVGAEPLLEGRVRLSSGQPAAGVQVRLVDLTDLRRSVGTTTDAAGFFALSLQTLSGGTALPTDFALGQNYPNPFNPSTVIPYQLPASGHVRLDVFNVLGQRLATLVDAERSAGAHTAQWGGTDASGRAVGAGVYIYRLSSGGMTESRRMVLVDGQAGIPAAGAATQEPVLTVEGVVEADDQVYGLTVSGEGLVAYVNPAFRVGVDAADIVVEEHGGSPRMKLAAGGLLGDVNNDDRVDISDVLYVLLYIMAESSMILPNNGDISLGDVNKDGTVDLADVLLLVRYTDDPFDPALPVGINATEVSLGSSISGSLSEGDVDYFFIEMSSEGLLVATTTGSTSTYGYILDSSGNVLDRDYYSGAGFNFHVSASVSSGTYYIVVEGYESATGDYTLEVQSLTRLTHSAGDDRSPAWSPSGQRIIFESNRDGNWDIYVVEADGTNLTRLTHSAGDDRSPAWSPSGQRIIFESSRDGNWDIYIMEANSSNLINLTENAGDDRDPAWSPDGQRIAFESNRDGNWDIYVVEADGTNLTRLTHSADDDKDPIWSPDGQRIAFESNRDGNWDIYVMGADGSNLTRVTHSTDEDWGRPWSPVWSPDGQRIAFESRRADDWDIYVVEADGSNLTRLTRDAGNNWFSVWSPDGQRIAFESDRDGYGDIYVMEADGTNLTNLTLHNENDWGPVWSPDGQRIAFMSNRDRSGDYEIYIMDVD